MNTSAEAADQVVKMTLNGVEIAAKITGTAAKELAVLLYAILKDQKKTKGKTRLTSMIRSGKELKVFAVKNEDLELFCTEAKKYGVLYCVLRDKDSQDGITDIMIRAQDAPRINHIFERFKLATVDMGSVRSQAERGVEMPDQTPSPEPKQPQKPNPTKGRTENLPPSEPTSKSRENVAGDISEVGKGKRPSVRQELRRLKAEQSRAGSVPRVKGPKERGR